MTVTLKIKPVNSEVDTTRTGILMDFEKAASKKLNDLNMGNLIKIWLQLWMQFFFLFGF